MNALDALVFAALGAVMEILPKAFPSWFPPTGSDQASARALWLALMGVVQISIGVVDGPCRIRHSRPPESAGRDRALIFRWARGGPEGLCGRACRRGSGA
jgi:hypothetical protein